MTRGWRCSAARLVVVYCLLKVCGAENIPCTVTQGTDQTTYSVLDEGQSGCTYSWSNASDTGHSVLAHEEGWKKGGPVRSANVSTIIITECFPRIIYQRHCPSEGEEHTSTCNISCLEKLSLKEDDVADIKTTSRSRIITFVVTSIAIILLVGLICLFTSKKTCFYSLVNMKNVEAQATVRQ